MEKKKESFTCPECGKYVRMGAHRFQILAKQVGALRCAGRKCPATQEQKDNYVISRVQRALSWGIRTTRNS